MWKLWGDVEEQWIEDDEVFVKVEGDPEAASTCPDCGYYVGEGEEHGPDCEYTDWTPPETPETWCNGAGIRIDPSNDSVTVSISVGDPRGAFAFTVRRLSDGRLVIHTPHPGEGMPHMQTKEVHEGTLEITGG